MKGTKHITVTSREQAWKEVDHIFPCDYEEDARSSENAGYPIYKGRGTVGEMSWISDLCTSLELNIYNGKTIETTKIHIEEETGMKATYNREYEIKNIQTINFAGGVLTIIYKTDDGEVKVTQYTKESIGNGQLNIF